MKKKWMLLFAIIALVSCEKSDNTTDNKTTTCTLSSSSIVGVYKITKATMVTIAAGQTTEVDATSFIDANELDDLYEFKAGGVFNWTDAGVRNPGSIGAASTSWTLTGNKLSPDIQSYLPNPWNYIQLEDFTVVNFTCDSMALQKKLAETTNNVTFETGVRYYLKRQQ